MVSVALVGDRKKGDSHLLCEAPYEPFRQKVAVTFFAVGVPYTSLFRGIAMSKNYRLGVVLVLATVFPIIADSRFAFAQRITFGGQSNQSNRDDDDDDDDDDEHNNQRDNRSSRSGNRDLQQIQQLLQGGQGGQGQSGQGQSGLRIGNWQGGKWQGARDIEKWTAVFGGNQKPFSAQWYQEHPKAWKYDHHQSNVWVVATLPGVYSWLGWGNVPPQYGGGFGNAPQFDPSHYGDWYPLGVYSLMSAPGDMGTRIVQLAVDRHGHVAGNYYDMITDSNYSVAGDIQRQSQRVYWSLNKNKFIRFRAHISQLLRPYGSVIVQLPGGEQEWQFVRLEN